VILYKKADWTNIDDSIRRLVYDLTVKDPNERLPLSKVIGHVWLKPHFKEILEEVKGNYGKSSIMKPKKIKSEIESQLQSRLDSELDSKNNGTLKIMSNGSSQNFMNFALNSVNSLFIQTNGTSENSYCLLSPGVKSFNSIMDSPKEKQKKKSSEENVKPRSFYLNEVLSDTERTMRFCVFADENPVEKLIQNLNNQNKKPRPSKNFRFI